MPFPAFTDLFDSKLEAAVSYLWSFFRVVSGWGRAGSSPPLGAHRNEKVPACDLPLRAQQQSCWCCGENRFLHRI